MAADPGALLGAGVGSGVDIPDHLIRYHVVLQ